MAAPWSLAELETLRTGAEGGEGWDELAARLPGRSARNCYFAARKRGWTKGEAARVEEHGLRRCLSCRDSFAPAHRCNFVCDGCRSTVTWQRVPA